MFMSVEWRPEATTSSLINVIYVAKSEQYALDPWPCSSTFSRAITAGCSIAPITHSVVACFSMIFPDREQFLSSTLLFQYNLSATSAYLTFKLHISRFSYRNCLVPGLVIANFCSREMVPIQKLDMLLPLLLSPLICLQPPCCCRSYIIVFIAISLLVSLSPMLLLLLLSLLICSQPPCCCSCFIFFIPTCPVITDSCVTPLVFVPNILLCVNSKKKNMVVVCWKAFLSLRNFCLFSVETWWAAIHFLCLLISWKITIWQKSMIHIHKNAIKLVITK